MEEKKQIEWKYRYFAQYRDQNCNWVRVPKAGYFDKKVDCYRAVANAAYTVDLECQQIVIKRDRYS